MTSKLFRKALVPTLNLKQTRADLKSVQASPHKLNSEDHITLTYDTSESPTNEHFSKDMANTPQFNGSQISPGQLKKSSDKMAALIKKTKETFSAYDLELIFEEYLNSRTEIYTLLETLVHEISCFPQDFFKGIRIKKLVISAKEESNSPQPSNHFFFSDINIEKKIGKKLHKLIFEQIMFVNPKLLEAYKLDYMLYKHYS